MIVSDHVLASKLGICAPPSALINKPSGAVLPITVAEVNRLLREPTLSGIFRTANHVTQGKLVYY